MPRSGNTNLFIPKLVSPRQHFVAPLGGCGPRLRTPALNCIAIFDTVHAIDFAIVYFFVALLFQFFGRKKLRNFLNLTLGLNDMVRLYIQAHFCLASVGAIFKRSCKICWLWKLE